jgi:hypothetical protein
VWIFWRRDRSVADLAVHSQIIAQNVLYHMVWKMTRKRILTKWDRSLQFDVGRIGCHSTPLNMIMPLEVL